MKHRDNTFGSISLSVRLSVGALTVFLLVLSGRYWYLALPSTAKGPVKHKSATLLKNIIECSSQEAFKIVGCSKWLLFQQVAPLRSITLLIVWCLQSALCSSRSQLILISPRFGSRDTNVMPTWFQDEVYFVGLDTVSGRIIDSSPCDLPLGGSRILTKCLT